MGVFQTASDTFFSVCSTLALIVTTVTDWIGYILHVNYVLVTNLYTSICYVLTLILTAVDWILQVVFVILSYVFDFLYELYACARALLVLLWHICVLVYKVLSLAFTGLEMLVVGVWNGGVLTYKTLQQSAMDVVETCESTTDHVIMMAQDLVVYVCSIFTAVGSFSTWLVRSVWVGIGYIPATISNIPSYVADWISSLWMRCTMWVSLAFMNVNNDTYIGLGLCCLLYVTLSRVIHVLFTRRHSVWIIFRRRRFNNRQAANAYTPVVFDRGFESDFEDDDIDGHAERPTDFDSDNSDRGEDSDAPSELTLTSDNDSDDDNSAGSESDVSLNSQTFTSEDSDHDIDIQLPIEDGDNSRHSRSSTPSRHLSKDMNAGDFEQELERERDKRKCVVCQDANKSVLILPCRHMCLCVTCANQIVRSTLAGRRICPLCRTRIERVMDVFV